MTVGFWDTPEHLPTGGWPVGSSKEGTLTGLQIARNSWGNIGLRYALDGQDAWANRSLWSTMAAARVDVGDRVRITKTHEDQSNGKVRTHWTVERIQAPAYVQPAPTPATMPRPAQTSIGPSW